MKSVFSIVFDKLSFRRCIWFLKWILGPALAVLLTSCMSEEVDLNFIPTYGANEPLPIDSQVSLGHFSDRRDKGPYWIGEILGQYRYPKTTLSTKKPVALIVQSVVKENAENRGLLSTRPANAAFQLSGEIIRLESIVAEKAEARVYINIRLTTLDGSQQVYQKLHRAYLVDIPDEPKRHTATELLKDALNQAVSEALDAEALREWLLVGRAT